MYIGGKRGMGAVVSVPFGTWGLVGTPCQSSDGSVIAADGSVMGSSSALTWAGLLVGGILLYSAFGEGK